MVVAAPGRGLLSRCDGPMKSLMHLAPCLVRARRGPGRQALDPRGGGLHCVQAPLAARQTGTRAELALAPLRAVVRLRRPTVLGAQTSCARRIARSDAQPGLAARLGTANGASHLPAWAARSTLGARGCAQAAVLAKPWVGGCGGPFALPRSTGPCGRARPRALQALDWRTLFERSEPQVSAESCAPGRKGRAPQGSPS